MLTSLVWDSFNGGESPTRAVPNVNRYEWAKNESQVKAKYWWVQVYNTVKVLLFMDINFIGFLNCWFDFPIVQINRIYYFVGKPWNSWKLVPHNFKSQ